MENIFIRYEKITYYIRSDPLLNIFIMYYCAAFTATDVENTQLV